MLKLGGYINLLISVMHFAALYFLDDAFRLTGVSEEMSRAAEIWPCMPAAMTVFVAVVFAVFGIYALAAAGVLKWKLPLLKPAVYLIGFIYILRGAAGLVFNYPAGAEDFMQVLFSLCALGIGALYMTGGWVAFGGMDYK